MRLTHIFARAYTRKGVICLVLLTLAFSGIAIYVWNEGNHVKTSLTGIAQGQPTEICLMWVDCDARLKSHELSILRESISSTGARFRGQVFSPNMDYIWLLFETRFDKVSEVSNIQNVLNVSIGEETEWKWDLWWHYQKIDPLLELQLKRVQTEFPGERVEVCLSFKITGDIKIDRNNVIELVEGLGGTVTRIGYAEFMDVLMPLDAIDVLATYDSIQEIRATGPIIAN